MRVNTDLEELIASLSGSEKRYFRLFSSLNSGNQDKNTIALFDNIAHKENQSIHLSKKQLSNARHTLYKSILNSLKNFYAGKSLDSYFYQELESIRILFKKDLLNKCGSRLQALKKQAYLYEQHRVLLEIFHLEKNLIYLSNSKKDILKKAPEVYSQEGKVIKAIENLHQYKLLTNEMNTIFSLGLETNALSLSKKTEQLTNNPYIKNKKMALSNIALDHYYALKSTIFYLKNDLDNAIILCEDRILNWEKNKIKIDGYFSRYLLALNNALDIYFMQHNQGKAQQIIQKIKNLYSRLNTSKYFIHNQRAEVNFLYFNELRYYINFNFYNEAEKLIPTITNNLSTLRGVNRVSERTYFYQFALIYFIQNKFEASLEWINKLLYDSNNRLKQAQAKFEILNLLVHFELKNYRLLEHLTLKNLKRKDLLKSEKKVLEFFKSFLLSAKNQPKNYNLLLSHLQSYQSDKHEQDLITSSKLIPWVKSKLQGKTMLEVLGNEFAK